MAIGIMVLAYGTPTTSADIAPYYTHIRGGRPPSAEALADLTERYRRVGGQTPLYELTKQVADELRARLEADYPGAYQVYLAMKHWHPFIKEGVAAIAADGLREVIGVVLAPHYSRYSLEGYRTYAQKALSELGEPFKFHFIEHWHDQPSFQQLIAERIAEARARFDAARRDHVQVVFSAHSLPEKIVAQGDPYPQQLRASAAAIAARAGLAAHHLCYQSAAPTPEPWLGPDILEMLTTLHAHGVREVLSVPFGFVSDHLEILWDIDIEAQERAHELGIRLERIRMPNADPEFVAVIEEIVLQHAVQLATLETSS